MSALIATAFAAPERRAPAPMTPARRMGSMPALRAESRNRHVRAIGS